MVLIPRAVSAAPDHSVSQGAAGTSAAVPASVRPAVVAGPGPGGVGLGGGAGATPPEGGVTTAASARLNFSTTWTTLPCGSTTVSVPRGRVALVVAHVDAEVSCQGPANQWCQGRVLIGGVEGEPN